MERNVLEIEQIVFNRFKAALKQPSIEIRLYDRWYTPLLKRRFDIVIYKKAYPLAVIEVRSNIEDKNLLAITTDQVRSAISITNSRYGIATDNEIFYFYDRNKKDIDFIALSFEEIINKLINPEKVEVLEKDVLSIILKAAKQHLEENTELLNFINSVAFLSRIQFDPDSHSYIFEEEDKKDAGDTTAFENKFFNAMFGEFKDTKICRYTSLKTIFEMLNQLSFRMCGLVGMNDKSEVNYVESYLNMGNASENFAKPLIKESLYTITNLNKRYITSCSKIGRKDDLTLWRLYSDDARGVCLVFDVKCSNLNKNVLLQKVKYAKADGTHKELDFLRQIKEEVELKTGFKFEFRELGYWKHFFKSYDYAIEDEVRLLIMDNGILNTLKTDWVMTNTHSIFNPVIDFQLNSKAFPIHLKTIILGSKCPERDVNKVQIEEMISRKKKEIKVKSYDSNLNNLKVGLSKINHYR